MTVIPFFQVDAFAARPFSGNPAAVCPLASWLPDATLQAIAAENNLSETAFFVMGADAPWDLRWFTPTVEVDLCGHATLAAGFVVLTELRRDWEEVVFHSASGPLRVARAGHRFALDLPARPGEPAPVPPELAEALGVRPAELFVARDWVACVAGAEQVRAARPDFARLAALGAFGVCLTAPGTGADADVDFVSRFFAPAQGIDEDPVTGSAHCTLAPLWAGRLGKASLRARQVSARGGELRCSVYDGRVRLEGEVIRVIEGTLHV